MTPGIRSPVDPSALPAVLAPLDQARSLPGDAYTSPEVLSWEREHFFEASWVCVGRGAEVSDPGDQAAVRVSEEGVLLVRGEDRVLRAFSNVCRHRGHELLEPGVRSSARIIRCPYHAWVYSLEGRLRGAPRFKTMPSSDPVYDGLVPAGVAEWHGWVFVNATATAPPFETHVGNLEDLVAPYRPERLALGGSHAYEVDANWKIVTENYHECYHCTSIHPELCRVTPPTSGGSSDPRGCGSAGPWSSCRTPRPCR